MLSEQTFLNKEIIRTMEVLVLDDCPDTLNIISGYLSSSYYLNVNCFTLENDALASYVASKPDLVIIDMNLMNLDGIRVSILFKQLSPIEIPFIFISQNEDKKKEVENFYGIESLFLRKPLNRNELLMTVFNSLYYKKERRHVC
ncbi:MAG: response regulator RpfG family c-di-GMP phosphodiesterase [Bacteriovoracaceae bacterium]|jgi:response regulator RpfG family c-di-GMP phosphodiesterase